MCINASFSCFFFHVENPTGGQLSKTEAHLRNVSLLIYVHKDGIHAGKDTCGLCVYLAHTLSSLLSLFQGGGVQRFIGNKIGTLNVINGFDFWNGS